MKTTRTRRPAPARVPVQSWLRTLLWLDGSPLVLEPYRMRIFEQAFDVDAHGHPRHSQVLCSRGKKNAKSLDLVLAGLYTLLLRDSVQGSDGYILANDEDQAADDLDLAVKLVRANPAIEAEVVIRAKSIERKDGRGSLTILPARDVAGAHGKTAAFIGFDEIHEYRDYALLEALSPDPTRRDVLVWIASYDSLWHTPGRPLWDLYQRGRAGTDSRMLFSWYSGDYCTDPEFATLPSAERANPSMSSWTNSRYLEEQQLRLPSARFRRLHLNLGGQPEGAFLNAGNIEAAVITGQKHAAPQPDTKYFGFVDMSGGSSDDACCGISHRSAEGHVVLDLLLNQGRPVPFNPRDAVRRFVVALKQYGVSRIKLDAYAGRTFIADFEQEFIGCTLSKPKSELYETFEVLLNRKEVRLLDLPTLTEQLMGLVWRGGKVDHVLGEHDDWCNAAVGALLQAVAVRRSVVALPTYMAAGRGDDDEGRDHEGAVLDSGGSLGEQARSGKRRGIPSGW